MGLFSKKKARQIHLKDFSSNGNSGGILTSFDRIQHLVVQNNSQEQLLSICDTILNGRAVLANFDKINANDANYMLSFISGVVYATEGEIFKIDNKLFLFGRKEEFADGSLHQYIEDTKWFCTMYF